MRFLHTAISSWEAQLPTLLCLYSSHLITIVAKADNNDSYLLERATRATSYELLGLPLRDEAILLLAASLIPAHPCTFAEEDGHSLDGAGTRIGVLNVESYNSYMSRHFSIKLLRIDLDRQDGFADTSRRAPQPGSGRYSLRSHCIFPGLCAMTQLTLWLFACLS